MGGARSAMLTGLVLLALGAEPVFAQVPQTESSARSRAVAAVQTRRIAPRARTRIQVSPNQRLYRQCEDWLAVEHRPSGDVITPQMRCWWATR